MTKTLFAFPQLMVFILIGAFLSDYIFALRDWDLNLTLILKKIYWHLHQNYYVNPFFSLGIAVICLLQWLAPVQKNRALFKSTGFDFTYTLFFIPFYLFVVPVFSQFLLDIYSKYFYFLTFDFSYEFSPLVSIIIGYLLVDFLGWLHHLARHKIPVFWLFHELHHSQENMNLFTNFRVHVIDWFNANFIKFIPAIMFTNSLDIILNYIVIHQFLDRLNHSNIKTNLGWFRYVFVTPQSHRVHHSGEKAFYDKNFGVSLSIWDHLFKTQCTDYNVYPSTGIPDKKYPFENSNVNFFWLFWLQFTYPFKKFFKKMSS